MRFYGSDSFFLFSQVPLFIPAIFSFTCFFMVFLSLYSDPVTTGIGFAISLTGVPAYYIFIVSSKPKWLLRLLGEESSVGFSRRVGSDEVTSSHLCIGYSES